MSTTTITVPSPAAFTFAAAAPTINDLADWAPGDIISGWTSDGTDITIPIASLLGLTAADADAATGDMRAVMLAINKTVFGWYNSASPKPTAMAMTYTRAPIQNYNTYIGKVKDGFRSDFYLDYPAGTVAAEE